MLNHSEIRHHVLQKAGIALLLGLLVWALLLAQTAMQLRSVETNGQNRSLTFGPLNLMEIAKHVDDEGAVHAQFTVQDGMAWYLLIWTTAGAVVGFCIAKPVKGSKKPEKTT